VVFLESFSLLSDYREEKWKSTLLASDLFKTRIASSGDSAYSCSSNHPDKSGTMPIAFRKGLKKIVALQVFYFRALKHSGNRIWTCLPAGRQMGWQRN